MGIGSNAGGSALTWEGAMDYQQLRLGELEKMCELSKMHEKLYKYTGFSGVGPNGIQVTETYFRETFAEFSERDRGDDYTELYTIYNDVPFKALVSKQPMEGAE